MINYIGDISIADAQVLMKFAEVSTSILEFGVGGSTQILQEYRPGISEMLSVDTSQEWIERTQDNLARLKIPRVHQMLLYKDWQPSGEYDLIFDDGVDDLRLQFALSTFPLLKIGGYLLMHDTRRYRDMRNFAEVMTHFGNNIDLVQLNLQGSNISVMRKKAHEPYINWQETEGKQPWQYGLAPKP